ncbi:MAG: hypothetical protein ABWY93_23150 [Mycobacterium sp.]
MREPDSGVPDGFVGRGPYGCGELWIVWGPEDLGASITPKAASAPAVHGCMAPIALPDMQDERVSCEQTPL